jgi:hypothetical protein
MSPAACARAFVFVGVALAAPFACRRSRSDDVERAEVPTTAAECDALEDAVRAKLGAFYRMHEDCRLDDDCVLASLDCSSGCSGAAVAKSAAATAAALQQSMRAGPCAKWHQADCWSLSPKPGAASCVRPEPRCVDGKCRPVAPASVRRLLGPT